MSVIPMIIPSAIVPPSIAFIILRLMMREGFHPFPITLPLICHSAVETIVEAGKTNNTVAAQTCVCKTGQQHCGYSHQKNKCDLFHVPSPCGASVKFSDTQEKFCRLVVCLTASDTPHFLTTSIFFPSSSRCSGMILSRTPFFVISSVRSIAKCSSTSFSIALSRFISSA